MGGSFPLFPPWRNVSWASSIAPRSRPVCAQSLLVSGASKSSWAVGHGGRLAERFQIPFRMSAVVLTDSALASWKFLATVAFSSSKFWVDWSAFAIFSSTLTRAAVWSWAIWLLRALSQSSSICTFQTCSFVRVVSPFNSEISWFRPLTQLSNAPSLLSR